MMSTEKKYGTREYSSNDVVWFRKTKEAYGALSNMCSGFPLVVNGHPILTSEAIYQACRFPYDPDIQKLIIAERSPMTAKMKSKPYRDKTRPDWDSVRIPIMRWCLQVKLAQNYDTFGKIIESTKSKVIVEDSRKDRFWGAVREKTDENKLSGVNALGRLLMELRHNLFSENKYNLLVVDPLNIPDFNLFGESIQRVDSRVEFVKSLIYKLGVSYHFENLEISTNNKVSEPIFSKHGDGVITANPNDNLERVIDDKDSPSSQVEKQIRLVLKYGNPLSSKDIIKRIQSDWDTRKMTSFLKSIEWIDVVKGSPLKFKAKSRKTEPAKTLFAS